MWVWEWEELKLQQASVHFSTHFAFIQSDYLSNNFSFFFFFANIYKIF